MLIKISNRLIKVYSQLLEAYERNKWYKYHVIAKCTAANCKIVILQEAQTAVMKIDVDVKAVSKLAQGLYGDRDLNPELDQLVQAAEKTINIMGELNNSLKCDQLHRYIIYFFYYRFILRQFLIMDEYSDSKFWGGISSLFI